MEHPSHAFRHVGPNWFAAVMGTGILANAAVLLPKQFGALRDFALGAWILAVAVLVVLLAATAAHWLLHPDRARAHLRDPRMAPFYGAPPMALLTVGAGALLVGRDLIGLHAAVVVDSVLWGLGTVSGLLVCAAIPALMRARRQLEPRQALATWLMPVVPPMVSASTGAALIAHLPTTGLRLAMLIACYAMFALSLALAVTTIVLVVRFRLGHHRADPPELVPTLWIVLGPLGQSVTAVGLLGAAASGVVGAPLASALGVFGTAYGLPVLAFALVWLALVTVITARTARRHLPFALTWWSFTFPVGTVVTGTSVLAAQTGSGALAWLAVGLYAFLVCAWATAFGNTLRGVWSGALFVPPRDPALAYPGGERSAADVTPSVIRCPQLPAQVNTLVASSPDYEEGSVRAHGPLTSKRLKLRS